MNKVRITLWIDKKLVEDIDKEKGLASRSRYVESLLKKVCEKDETSKIL